MFFWLNRENSALLLMLTLSFHLISTCHFETFAYVLNVIPIESSSNCVCVFGVFGGLGVGLKVGGGG